MESSICCIMYKSLRGGVGLAVVGYKWERITIAALYLPICERQEMGTLGN